MDRFLLPPELANVIIHNVGVHSFGKAFAFVCFDDDEDGPPGWYLAWNCTYLCDFTEIREWQEYNED